MSVLIYIVALLILIPVGILAATQIWKRPVLGIVLTLVLMAVPWSGGSEGRELVNVSVPDLAIAVLVGFVAVRALVVGDERRLRSWVVLPLAGIVVAGSAATLFATDQTASLAGLIRYTQIFAVVPAATYLAIRSRGDLKLILGTVVALGLFEGIVGIYQFFAGTGASYGESNARIIGTFGAYNIMSLPTILTYAMIAAAAIFLTLKDHRRIWALLLLVALCFPLALTLSRGSWIAAGVGVTLMVVLIKPKHLVSMAVLAVGVTLLISFGASESTSDMLEERLTSISSVRTAPDQSVQDRYALWQAAVGMWADHPFTGVGMKNFPRFRDLHASLDFSGGSDITDPTGGFRRVALLTPHNMYLLILAEQGLVGALAYGLLLLSLGIASLIRVLKMKLSSIASVEMALGLSSLGFLTSYLVNSLYGDIGGTDAVLESVLLGGLVWFASEVDLEEEA